LALIVSLTAAFTAQFATTAFAGDYLRVSGSRIFRKIPLQRNTFELSWMHSVELTEWRETYTIDPDGRILLSASEFASAGAGLPDRMEDGEVFQQRGGTTRIAVKRPPLEVLRVRLSEVSHHVLRVGERRIDLNGIFGEDTVSIRVEK